MAGTVVSWAKDLNEVPYGPLGIIAMNGCEKIGEMINTWLLKWHSLEEDTDTQFYTVPGGNRDSFLI